MLKRAPRRTRGRAPEPPRTSSSTGSPSAFRVCWRPTTCRSQCAEVKRLSIGQRQMIEIGKALMRDARVIAFDEPTSSLSARETEHLFTIISALRAQGRAVIYVTHRMDEVYELCDRVTVFRDGRRIE